MVGNFDLKSDERLKPHDERGILVAASVPARRFAAEKGAKPAKLWETHSEQTVILQASN